MCQGIELIQNYKKKNSEVLEMHKDNIDQSEKINQNENLNLNLIQEINQLNFFKSMRIFLFFNTIQKCLNFQKIAE